MSIQEDRAINYDDQIVLYGKARASDDCVIGISCFAFVGFFSMLMVGFLSGGKLEQKYSIIGVVGIVGMVSTLAIGMISLKLLDKYWEKRGLREAELIEYLRQENRLHLLN